MTMPSARYLSGVLSVLLFATIVMAPVLSAPALGQTSARAEAPAGRSEAPVGRSEAPVGQMIWAVHFSLAPTFFDPAETPGIITPFLVLYALHDALVKPMPGKPQ